MQFPTGGKAHEPQGMIRCNSEADSTVWMKEDKDRCISLFEICDICDGRCSEMILSFQSFFILTVKQAVSNKKKMVLWREDLRGTFCYGNEENGGYMTTDESYMKMALKLAECGIGAVNPNPLVGAVIVKDGRVIGKGWHAKYGGLHAERNALADCKESPKGATIYVTLEPCCHYGKTPPCTEAILQSGIRRVVTGSADPNPLVAGKGIKILQDAGLTVDTGVLKEECDALNAVFFHYIKEKTPYVVMKYAMTLDGKIATASGASKWITGEEARKNVQNDRNRYMAIMAGVGTVLADDPKLTCRIPGGRNPIRIICDSKLRTPFKSNVVAAADEGKTILATACTDEEKIRPYLEAGCEVLTIPEKEGHIDLNVLMRLLGEKGIDSILLEGGGTLNYSALKQGIVHKVQAYIAPKLFGGADAKSPVEGCGVILPADGFLILHPTIRKIGADILIEGEVGDSCLRD